MEYKDFLIDAIDIVLSWNISDEAIADAVIAQANLMAGSYLD